MNIIKSFSWEKASTIKRFEYQRYQEFKKAHDLNKTQLNK